MKLRLGSRSSKLALRQSNWVAERLATGGCEVEIREISTRGDEKRGLAFNQIGAPGVFVRELERALLDGEVDVVVHSYKDLPSASPEGLSVAAVPERLDAADCLIVRPSAIDARRHELGELLPLAAGAKVGTASARREALVRDLRPDLEVEHLRGNVPTRIDKLRGGAYDAILLAAAGLERLGEPAEGLLVLRLDPAVFVPAPSQGALAVQVREPSSGRTSKNRDLEKRDLEKRDLEIRRRVAEIDEPTVRPLVAAERRLQALIEGGCQTAFGAWCRRGPGGVLVMDAVLDGPGGLRRASGSAADPHELAHSLLPTLRPDGSAGGSPAGDGSAGEGR